jgi:hypothetical protein
LDLIYSRPHIMSSGDTSQRMEFLITKSGPRITAARARAAAGILVLIVVLVIVMATDTMLPSFCNDLVQGCKSWQT